MDVERDTDSWISAMDLIEVYSSHIGKQRFFDVCQESINAAIESGRLSGVAGYENTGTCLTAKHKPEDDLPLLRFIV